MTSRRALKKPSSLPGGIAAGLGIALLLAACGGSAGDTTSSAANDNDSASDAPASSAANDNDSASDAPAGSGAGLVDPCSLLTTAEIEAATGFPATAPGGDFDYSCTWELETGETDAPRTVSVLLFGPSRELFELQISGAEPVSGLGEEAAWRPSLAVLYVLDGQHGFSVQVALLSVDQLPIATELAKDVLARL
jgi:hypothetical protein